MAKKNNKEKTKQVSLGCLEKLARVNGEFYKIYHLKAIEMRDEFEKHLDAIEQVIVDSGYANDIPKAIEDVYNSEMDNYKGFVDLLQESVGKMHANNDAIYNEIAHVLSITKEALDKLSEDFLETSRRYNVLKASADSKKKKTN